MAKKSQNAERITKMLVLPDGESEFAGYEQPGIVDKDSANAAIAAFGEQGVDVPIDFDHSTLDKGTTPNATGWIKSLAYEKGKGLMATVELSDEAEALIRDKKVKYVSPVAVFNKETHKITRLHSLALTNKPATKHMPEILEYAANHGLKLSENEFAVAACMDYMEPNDQASKAAKSMRETAYFVEACVRMLTAQGVAIPPDQDPETTLQMAMDQAALMFDAMAEYETEKATMAATEKTEGNGDIVVALAKSLGLSKDAKPEQLVLAVEKLKATSANNDEVKVLREELTTLKEERAKEVAEAKAVRIKNKIDAAKKDNRLNPHNKPLCESVERIYALSEDEGDKMLASMTPIVPSGRTVSADEPKNTRETIIAATTKRFDDEDMGARGCVLKNQVNGALLDAGFKPLTAKEVAGLATVEV